MKQKVNLTIAQAGNILFISLVIYDTRSLIMFIIRAGELIMFIIRQKKKRLSIDLNFSYIIDGVNQRRCKSTRDLNFSYSYVGINFREGKFIKLS